METSAQLDEPIVSFYRFISQCRPPLRADRSAAGTLPTRGYRYCDPVTSASGFGWYLFPPIDFNLVWDGTRVFWTYAGSKDWYALTSAQFPGFKKHFAINVPPHIAPYAPPFLSFDPHLHIIQIWSGYIAKTREDWSLLVRPVVNILQNECLQVYEGIIETDRWFGPLFTNLRLIARNVTIEFRAEFPFLQIQPLHRNVYSDAVLNNFKVVTELSMIPGEDWARFEETVIEPNTQQPRAMGHYAVAVRKRRKTTDVGHD